MKATNLINGQKPEFRNLELQREENERREMQEAEDWYKNLSPQEKWFDAFVNVDWTMGAIQEKVKELTTFFNGRSPLDIMIDKSSGYDKGRIKGFLLYLKGAYEELIRNFKIMDDDRAELYQGLLEKINLDLKTNYKKIKEVKI
jgi:hypothetical protein